MSGAMDGQLLREHENTMGWLWNNASISLLGSHSTSAWFIGRLFIPGSFSKFCINALVDCVGQMGVKYANMHQALCSEIVLCLSPSEWKIDLS